MTSGSASMTMTPITMEPQGISIAPGDHICAFYRGNAQREEVLLPFLRDGIRAGDKCIAVMDDPELRRVLEPLSTSLDVEASLSARQLDLLCSDSAYLAGGSFSLERMLDFWELGVGGALRSGFTFVRAVGEMTWALRDLPGVEDLVRYEARLNRFLPRYPQVILCLYDLERFTDGQVLMELLRTHPKVLLSGQLLENPWYIEPDDAEAVA
jgi:MEDS: MEthanogen/methylotroph, DcmR Sensory domain